MHNIVQLFRFCRTFGFTAGMKLFLGLKTGKLENIKISGIKYPFSMRSDTSDIHAFLQVFQNEEYNVNFGSPKTIIDCGANIGMFSILAANRYPDATIIAVEPDTDNFSMLRRNTQQYSNVICVNAGIWNRATQLRVYDKYNSGSWGLVVEEAEDGPIPAVSITDLVKRYGIEEIDVLKLDIEGTESQIFAHDYAEWLHLAKIILIELHDWRQPGCAKAFFEAVNNTFPNYRLQIKGENIILWRVD